MHRELRDYFSRANMALGELGDDDSLLEAGVIDSLSMESLVAHLQETYAVSIDEDDLVPENFESIDAIARFVRSKKAAD